MEFKDAAGQMFERSNAMQTFWGFYITIALALIAFFGADQRSKALAAILTVAFIGIATVNLGGMLDVARQRLALHRLLQQASAPTATPIFRDGVLPPTVIDAYLSSVHPPTVGGVVVTHLFCDVAVIAAIWVLTLC